MKKNIYSLLIMAVVVLMAVTACDHGLKWDDLEVGEPFSKPEGVFGSWIAEEINIADPATDTERNVIEYFGLSSYTIEFRQDGTFSVTGGLEVANFIGMRSGQWALKDSAELPDRIELTSGERVVNLRLLAPPREGTPLRVAFDRQSGGETILSYKYHFKKAN